MNKLELNALFEKLQTNKRNKQIKRKLTLAACVVAALVAVCVAYHQGTKAGRAAGVMAAFDDITACTNDGCSGYYTTATGVRCIYE